MNSKFRFYIPGWVLFALEPKLNIEPSKDYFVTPFSGISENPDDAMIIDANVSPDAVELFRTKYYYQRYCQLTNSSMWI